MAYEFTSMRYNLLVISYIVELTTVHTVLNPYFGLSSAIIVVVTVGNFVVTYIKIMMKSFHR